MVLCKLSIWNSYCFGVLNFWQERGMGLWLIWAECIFLSYYILLWAGIFKTHGGAKIVLEQYRNNADLLLEHASWKVKMQIMHFNATTVAVSFSSELWLKMDRTTIFTNSSGIHSVWQYTCINADLVAICWQRVQLDWWMEELVVVVLEGGGLILVFSFISF